MRFDPPMLSEGPLSGAVFVTTHGKILGHDDEGRPLIESSVKYDVTDQFEALVAERAERRRLEACSRCGNTDYCSLENPTCPIPSAKRGVPCDFCGDHVLHDDEDRVEEDGLVFCGEKCAGKPR